MTSQPDDKRARALELHLAGASYQTIADQLGYASKASAYKIVQQGLEDLGSPDLPHDESTELARLDAMLTGLWSKARRGDVAAIDRVLKIGERRSALLANRHPIPQSPKKSPLASVSNIPRPTA